MAKRLTDAEVQGRADKLWTRYRENDGSITRAEVEELLDINYHSARVFFKDRGVEMPIPDDTVLGRLAKKAEKLNSAGKDVLTTAEVAELLGLDEVRQAGNYYPQIAKHFSVPKMVSARGTALDVKMPSPDRHTFYDLHPGGLQAEPKRRLADGKVVYELR